MFPFSLRKGVWPATCKVIQQSPSFLEISGAPGRRKLVNLHSELNDPVFYWLLSGYFKYFKIILK